MNTINKNTPENLQETFRIMLMTLEYGGSVNSKFLKEIEQLVNKNTNFIPAQTVDNISESC